MCQVLESGEENLTCEWQPQVAKFCNFQNAESYFHLNEQIVLVSVVKFPCPAIQFSVEFFCKLISGMRFSLFVSDFSVVDYYGWTHWLLVPSNHSSMIESSHLISQVNIISLDHLTWNWKSNVKIADVWQSIRFWHLFKGGTSWFGIVYKSENYDLFMVGVLKSFTH